MEESPIDILPLQFILRIWSGMSPLLHRHSVITSTIVCSIHFFVYIFSFQLLSASPAPSVLFPFIFPFLFPFSFSFIFPLLSSLILIHIVSVVITIIGNSSNIDINFLSREGKFLIKAIPFITFNLELADMLQSYIHALNTKGYVPDWQSAWELTVKMAYQRAGMYKGKKS